MIITKLMGGLGNQMFQYSLGYRLAAERNVQLKLDVSWFALQETRNFQLRPFDINAEFATVDEIEDVLRNTRTDFSSRVIRKTQRYLPLYKRRLIRQQGLGFDPGIFKITANTYLDGYWQSEKYFKPIEDALRREFRYIGPISESGRRTIDMIEASTSASIHIRRGDYVSNAKTSEYHGVCSMDYYERSIKFLLSSTRDCHFFVFSDEPEWAMANIRIPGRVTYLARDSEDHDAEQLFLMSLCKNHIIANSTFSWWGAWLSSSSNKTVIAPAKWFNKPELETEDLIPAEWIKF
jgi:hypothetical protein